MPIFVLVETVILYSVWKFRMKPGEEEKDGPPIHGNTRLEVIWTALPAILILGLCIYAYTVLRSNEKNQPARWWSTSPSASSRSSSPIRAGQQQIVSPALYLPKGSRSSSSIRSLDVIHSFFVPEFSEKIDAVPGITTDAAGHADPARHLPGRVHGAVRRGPLADARRRPRRHARPRSRRG